MPNGEVAKNLYPLRLASQIPIVPDDKLPWYIWLGLKIGAIMAQPETPKGWGWNPSVITLCLVVAGMLVTGGYYVGDWNNERRQMADRLRLAEESIGKAKDLKIYTSGVIDGQKGHSANNDSNTNTQSKQE